MTPEQHESLSRYVRECADALGLRDWEVILDDDPCDDEDHAASVSCIYERRIAHVQVTADWMGLPPTEQRHVVAHELAHIHMDADLYYLHEVLPSLIGATTWSAIEAAVRRLHEQGVDGIASGLEVGLPLWVPE